MTRREFAVDGLAEPLSHYTDAVAAGEGHLQEWPGLGLGKRLPSRSFAPDDSVLKALKARPGYQATRYRADSATVFVQEWKYLEGERREDRVGAPDEHPGVPDVLPRRQVGLGGRAVGLLAPDRLATVLDDVLTLPTPALHLQIGDATEHGTAAEDEIALDWLARLPGPHRTILGNHDILHNRRTDGQWARAYGLRSKNFVVDLQFARIVAVGPDRNFPAERAGLLSPGTLAWLERELERSPHDCWIASHWPLFGTVLGDPKKLFTSAMSSFHAKPDRDLRKLLARHRNAKAWLSGHTHSPLSAPGLVTRARLARRRPCCRAARVRRGCPSL